MAGKRKRLGGLTYRSGPAAEDLTAAEAVGIANQAEAPAKRKRGPAPDPERRALRAFLFKLRPEQGEALRRAAAARVGAGRATRLDSSEVLRLLLDAWMGKGAKAP